MMKFGKASLIVLLFVLISVHGRHGYKEHSDYDMEDDDVQTFSMETPPHHLSLENSHKDTPHMTKIPIYEPWMINPSLCLPKVTSNGIFNVCPKTIQYQLICMVIADPRYGVMSPYAMTSLVAPRQVGRVAPGAISCQVTGARLMGPQALLYNNPIDCLKQTPVEAHLMMVTNECSKPIGFSLYCGPDPYQSYTIQQFDMQPAIQAVTIPHISQKCVLGTAKYIS